MAFTPHPLEALEPDTLPAQDLERAVDQELYTVLRKLDWLLTFAKTCVQLTALTALLYLFRAPLAELLRSLEG